MNLPSLASLSISMSPPHMLPHGQMESIVGQPLKVFVGLGWTRNSFLCLSFKSDLNPSLDHFNPPSPGLTTSTVEMERWHREGKLSSELTDNSEFFRMSLYEQR